MSITSSPPSPRASICSASPLSVGSTRSLPLVLLAYDMGCIQSIRRRLYHGETSAMGHLSSGMKGTATTVPFVVVYVTVPNAEAGKKLAESIVKEKLAACVNRVPGIVSVYWWNDEVQTDPEELLIIKTREALLTALTEHVKSNHDYEVPEVIALPIKDGDFEYLEWIKNSTRE